MGTRCADAQVREPHGYCSNANDFRKNECPICPGYAPSLMRDLGIEEEALFFT